MLYIFLKSVKCSFKLYDVQYRQDESILITLKFFKDYIEF